MLHLQRQPIEQNSSCAILENIPLADKNWFKTGGPARFFCQPHTEADFQYALAYARSYNLPLFLLGEGSNMLISDAGFDGLVVHPMLTATSHTIDGTRAYICAGAGVTMHNLISYCLEHQLLGLEEFSGIPGTVGGSVYINLHYFEFFLAQFLVSARIIDYATGTITTVDRDWFNFGYNTSTLLAKQQYLVSATFQLRHGSKEEAIYAAGRRAEIIRHRNRRYPTSNTCGSFFRSFYDHEVSLVLDGKKITFVAYYLDKVGVKGALSVGGARVSHQHANMIVNTGNATSSDIITLARAMQEKVHHTFGITPQPECVLVGFKEHPLLS